MPDSSNANPTPPERPGGRSSAFAWTVDGNVETVNEPVVVDAMDDQPDGFVDRVRRQKRSLTSIAISTLLHLGWLLLLLWFSFSRPIEPGTGVTATFDTASDSVSELDSPTVSIAETMEEFESPIEDSQSDVAEAIEAMAAEEDTTVPPIFAPSSSTPATERVDLAANGTPATSAISGGSLAGRDANSRAALAAARGGSAGSEAAVERAIRWLILHQDPYDGGWRFQQKCERCKNDGSSRSRAAATGLSLMAILGAGYTQNEGPYQEQVRNGLSYLVEQQRTRINEYGGPFDGPPSDMYVQAIATIALAESYVMTGDTTLLESLHLSRQYIIHAQNKRGGWRYRPNQAGDTLVTAWQIMALKSIEKAGISVPSDVYERTGMFLDSVQLGSGSSYRYLPQEKRKSDTATATGLLTRVYLGWPREQKQLIRGGDYIARQKFSRSDLYYNFYASLMLHHLQHRRWEQWSVRLRDYLVETQSRKGHQTGSWHFRDSHGNVGGRLYNTAMAAMTLEVYYRYSPIFSLPGE